MMIMMMTKVTTTMVMESNFHSNVNNLKENANLGMIFNIIKISLLQLKQLK